MGVLWPLAASGSGGNIRFTDEADRLPEDTSLPDTSTIDVDLIDIDGDGDLDLFVAEGTAGPFGRPNRMLVNEGDGFFTDETAARLPAGADNSSKADAGDIDGDGDLDIIIASLGPEQLLVNDGTGHFTDVSATALPPPPPFLNGISAEAKLADVDGDGDLDILVANENPFNADPLGGGQDRIYINDGTGHFTDETTARLPAVTDQTGGFAVGDIDDDGDLDVIVLNRGQDRIFINDGDGYFDEETAARFPITDDASRAAGLGDLDGDGDLDLLVANSRGQAPALYMNDGYGYFTPAVFTHSTVTYDTITSVELADLDGDGDLDALFGNAGTFLSGHGFLGGQNLYFRNNGVGLFKDRTSHVLPALADPTTDATFGDVDGDGLLDVVVGNSGATETVLIQGAAGD
ncbi:MAG: VCBS repeat-containing protein [Polyangiaceae bacterium]